MYKIIISGVVPDINKDEFLEELSQHGEIESLELEDSTATVTTKNYDTAVGVHIDYNGRYLRGKPVTAELILPN